MSQNHSRPWLDPFCLFLNAFWYRVWETERPSSKAKGSGEALAFYRLFDKRHHFVDIKPFPGQNCGFTILYIWSWWRKTHLNTFKEKPPSRFHLQNPSEENPPTRVVLRVCAAEGILGGGIEIGLLGRGKAEMGSWEPKNHGISSVFRCFPGVCLKRFLIGLGVLIRVSNEECRVCKMFKASEIGSFYIIVIWGYCVGAIGLGFVQGCF